MQFTIRRKLMLSYLGMAILIILASTYAVDRLQNLNQLANTIIHQDFAVLEAARQMTDILLYLENAEKKYLILKDASIADIFWTRSRELGAHIDTLGHNASSDIAAAAYRMLQQKKEYEGLFQRETALIGEKNDNDAQKLSATEGTRLMDALMTSARSLQKRAEKNIDGGMNEINLRSVRASRLTVLVAAVSLVVGLIVAILITFNISNPLKKLEKAAGLVAEGHFDTRLRMDRKDEIGHLAQAFNTMTQRLKVLEALHLDASPLTRLPGNLAIEQEIKQRLSQRQIFSLCHVDLDNFKPFADAYGYAWGSEVIKETALILEDAKREVGGTGDFIGHIGGDDFVLLSGPDGARRMCQQIVAQFEVRIRKFYNEEDRGRGFITAKDRQGQQRNFPLITITISIVTDDGTIYQNPLEMAKMAAEVKEYAKRLPGSNYVTKEAMEAHEG